MNASTMPVWTAADLHRQLSDGSRFAILDLRNRDEFLAWQIEGKTPLPNINMPYFELLDLADGGDDMVAAVTRAVPQKLQNSLPRNVPVLAVCARGETSPYVAEGLRQLGYEAYNLQGGMAAWGDHYEMRIIEDSVQLTLLQISRPARGCLSYLLASGSEAMVVDAARHIDLYTRIASRRGWRIRHVLDTHLQADHLSGGVALARAAGADYWLHPYDGIHPDDLLPATFPFRYLEETARLNLGALSVRPLHLPGHTLGMCSLIVDERFLLSGDTLFINTIGRPDLGGHAQNWTPLLYRSLQRLLTLPEHILVLPAHFSHLHEADAQDCYRASLGALRSHNEGLLMLAQGLPAFSSYIQQSLPHHPQAYDDIRRANIGLLQVSMSKASELELGRNQCALAQGEPEQRLAA